MATLRTRGLCALGNVSNSPPPKRTKRTKAISTCEDFEDSKDSDDGACAPKKKRKTQVCEDLRAALEVWNASQDVVCGRVAVGLSC